MTRAIQETSGGDHPAQVEGLKPCPFCGELPAMGCEPPEAEDGYFVSCDADCCPCCVREWLWAMSMKQARNQWNRRASAPQEGFVMVPREPTDGMTRAGFYQTSDNLGGPMVPSEHEYVTRVYRAMIAAAEGERK